MRRGASGVVDVDAAVRRLEEALDAAGDAVSDELLAAFGDAARMLAALRRERWEGRRDPAELAVERRAWAAYARATKPVGPGRGAVSSVGVLAALREYARVLIAEAGIYLGVEG